MTRVGDGGHGDAWWSVAAEFDAAMEAVWWEGQEAANATVVPWPVAAPAAPMAVEPRAKAGGGPGPSAEPKAVAKAVAKTCFFLHGWTSSGELFSLDAQPRFKNSKKLDNLDIRGRGAGRHR